MLSQMLVSAAAVMAVDGGPAPEVRLGLSLTPNVVWNQGDGMVVELEPGHVYTVTEYGETVSKAAPAREVRVRVVGQPTGVRDLVNQVAALDQEIAELEMQLSELLPQLQQLAAQKETERDELRDLVAQVVGLLGPE